MKFFQQLGAHARKLQQSAVALALGIGAGVASAAPESPFTTVVGTATTAVEGYGGALVALSGVAVLFWIAIKYVKKITGAS